MRLATGSAALATPLNTRAISGDAIALRTASRSWPTLGVMVTVRSLSPPLERGAALLRAELYERLRIKEN
jgi:hypothetical protein